MAYRVFELNFSDNENSSYSFYVGLVLGAAFYLYGVYKVEYQRTRNWKRCFLAFLIAVFIIIAGYTSYIFNQEFAAVILVFAWFFSLISVKSDSDV